MALGFLNIGERLKNVVKKTIDKGSEFVDKNIMQIVKTTKDETNETLHNPQVRQKRQLEENESQKKEILDELFNPEVRNKKIRITNIKTGSVREFYHHTKTGKVILLNLENSEKQIATRELLERDGFKVERTPEPIVKEEKKISDEENARMILEDLKKDQFVQYDVLRLLRKHYDKKYQLPEFKGEMAKKRKQSLQIVGRLLNERGGRLAPLIYKYLKSDRVEEPQNLLFGVEDTREEKWMENKPDRELFEEELSRNQNEEKKLSEERGETENGTDSKKLIKIGNRTLHVRESITYLKTPNGKEHSGIVLGMDTKGRLIVQGDGNIKLAFPSSTWNLIKPTSGEKESISPDAGRAMAA
jgi:hypothetical protein